MEPELAPWHECVAELLQVGHLAEPSSLAKLVNEALHRVRASVTIYLVDREQMTLRPLSLPGVPDPEPLPIDTTVAGRAFMTLESVVPPGQDDRVWIPMVDGADRLGVVEMVLPEEISAEESPAARGASIYASAIGYMVVAKTAYGETIRRARRSQEMSVGGELLWRTLPPLTFITHGFSLAAALEPCYDVGGDAFDYSCDDGVLTVGIFDAVGHGLSAALTSTLTLAAIRALRSAGADLAATVAGADEALTSQFNDSRYTTAILARIDGRTGSVQYVNAGHPPAVVIRNSQVVATLDAAPRPPLGIPGRTEVAEESLQPGDRLLFYTDGIIEARDDDGAFFGVDRLLDLAERHAASGLPASETLRRLSLAVQEYQGGNLVDEATLMLVEWAPSENPDALLSYH